MLNKQQREFRRQMKQIQSDKKKTGQENPYERSYRRIRYRKPLFLGGSGVTVIIILWNIYALSTWFHHSQSTRVVSGSTAQGNTAIPTVTNPEQQQVSDYIQTSARIQQQLVTLISPFLNPRAENMTSSFDSAAKELGNLTQTASANLDVLGPLRDFNTKQIGLVQSALRDVRTYQLGHQASEWQSAQKVLMQFNQDLQGEQAIVISILNKEHMPYEIDASGHITYHYSESASH